MHDALPTIVETPTFTRLVNRYLDDDAYRLLQTTLALAPERGKIIPGGNGIRKIRWQSKGHGKRGGVRIIYYWAKPQGIILMLFIYPKNDRNDLTPAQIKALGQFVREAFP